LTLFKDIEIGKKYILNTGRAYYLYIPIKKENLTIILDVINIDMYDDNPQVYFMTNFELTKDEWDKDGSATGGICRCKEGTEKDLIKLLFKDLK
jgi:hypothetical protein